MNSTTNKKTIELSPEDLALMGGGALGYIREIEGSEAIRLMGPTAPRIAPKDKLFALYHADGTPVSVSGTYEAAMGSAFEHELMPMSVH
jgi:hypothetical protein